MAIVDKLSNNVLSSYEFVELRGSLSSTGLCVRAPSVIVRTRYYVVVLVYCTNHRSGTQLDHHTLATRCFSFDARPYLFILTLSLDFVESHPWLWCALYASHPWSWRYLSVEPPLTYVDLSVFSTLGNYASPPPAVRRVTVWIEVTLIPCRGYICFRSMSTCRGMPRWKFIFVVVGCGEFSCGWGWPDVNLRGISSSCYGALFCVVCGGGKDLCSG